MLFMTGIVCWVVLLVKNALRKLLAAEKMFAEDSGVPLQDVVSEAVEYAKQILRGLEP